MKPHEVKRKLKTIRGLFEKIEAVYNSIPQPERDGLDNLYVEEYTVRHCLRWGYSTTEDMLEAAFKCPQCGKPRILISGSECEHCGHIKP